MSQLVLSLYPGIDLLGRAFEAEGMCVVRGPDPLWGGDNQAFHPPADRFDGVIGGPPCIGESNMAYLNGTPGYTMRDDFMRCVREARPAWWLMEAVKPHSELACHILKLSPRWLGEEQSRVRYFHSNLPLARYVDGLAALESPVFKHAVLAGHGSKEGTIVRGIATYSWEEMCRLQGLPADYDLPGFTREAKRKAVGNGVPLVMGRAVARAILAALAGTQEQVAA